MELPSARPLTVDELRLATANPLALFTSPPGGTTAVAIAEPPGGEYVRADQFVFQMSPGEHAEARLYASEFGGRAPGARVLVLFEPSQLQAQAGSPNLGPAPDVATPSAALEYPTLVTADDQGVAVLPMTAFDPGNPRRYIDGQVYGLRPVLEHTVFSPDSPYPYNPSDFISVLVWDDFRPDDPVTWFGSLQPIFQQFENLYPVMKRFVRLGDYESVCANRRDLLYAFGLEVSDPNYMPVTRDLSPAKRIAILRWLSDVGPDGNPLMGTPPPTPSTLAAGVAVEARGPADAPAPPAALAPAAEPPEDGRRGGKAAAASNRLVLTRPRHLPAGTVLGGIE